MAISDAGSEGGRPGNEPAGTQFENGNGAMHPDEPVFGEPGFEAPAELELGDDDIALPWLESDDDDEPASGLNLPQLFVFVLLGLGAIGLLVGGIWWVSRQGAENEHVAEGGVIQAPEGPYKERPKDPGGKTFDGTGDSSFKVSEGQSQKAQLNVAGGAAEQGARPGFTSVGKPSGKPGEGAAQGATLGSDASGIGVQIAAYSARSQAEDGWSRLSQQYPDLSGLRYRIVEGKADIGTVYRLQVLPGDTKAANALCGKLKAAGLNCNVKK